MCNPIPIPHHRHRYRHHYRHRHYHYHHHQVVGHEFPTFQRMKYADAVRDYGLDKPDLRYDMKLTDLTELINGQAGTAGMPLFKDAGLITAIAVPELGKWGNKKIKALEKRARTEAGAEAMVWLKCDKLPGKIDCSAKKNYSNDEVGARIRVREQR